MVFIEWIINMAASLHNGIRQEGQGLIEELVLVASLHSVQCYGVFQMRL